MNIDSLLSDTLISRDIMLNDALNLNNIYYKPRSKSWGFDTSAPETSDPSTSALSVSKCCGPKVRDRCVFHEGSKCLDEGAKVYFPKKGQKCPIGAKMIGADASTTKSQ